MNLTLLSEFFGLLDSIFIRYTRHFLHCPTQLVLLTVGSTSIIFKCFLPHTSESERQNGHRYTGEQITRFFGKHTRCRTRTMMIAYEIDNWDDRIYIIKRFKTSFDPTHKCSWIFLGNSDLTKLLVLGRFEDPGVAGVNSSSIERNLKQK